MRYLACLLAPALMLGGCSVLVPRTTPPPDAAGSWSTAGQGTVPSAVPDTGATNMGSSAGAGGNFATGAPTVVQGEWRVASVDGKVIELPHAITVTIDPATINVHSGCIGMGWNYTAAGSTITTNYAPVVSCMRGYFPQEQALFNALSGPMQASRTSSGGLELTGNGHRVLLFSQ